MKIEKVGDWSQVKVTEGEVTKSYWRRSDGYWFLWTGLIGRVEVKRSLNDKLEAEYQKQVVEQVEQEDGDGLGCAGEVLTPAIAPDEVCKCSNIVETYTKMGQGDREYCCVCNNLFVGATPPSESDLPEEETPDFSTLREMYVGNPDDESLQEATRTEPEYWVSRDHKYFYKIDNGRRSVSKRTSFNTWGDWKNCYELPSSIRRLCLKANSVGAVLTQQPTRPSEDDMMSKPELPVFLKDQGSNLEHEPTHDQHPQFRDIGIRIDRYGKMVFKPELVKKPNASEFEFQQMIISKLDESIVELQDEVRLLLKSQAKTCEDVQELQRQKGASGFDG